jgi:hypothetical protein
MGPGDRESGASDGPGGIGIGMAVGMGKIIIGGASGVTRPGLAPLVGAAAGAGGATLPLLTDPYPCQRHAGACAGTIGPVYGGNGVCAPGRPKSGMSVGPCGFGATTPRGGLSQLEDAAGVGYVTLGAGCDVGDAGDVEKNPTVTFCELNAEGTFGIGKRRGGSTSNDCAAKTGSRGG